jgi:predicted secreted protein
MSGYNGRKLLVKIGSTLIAAVQSKEITRAREAVDVTNDDDDGWRTLLPDPGMRTIDLSIEGVATAANYADILERWNGDTMESITLESPDGTTETGSFFLSNLTNGGEHNGNITFSAQLMSSGPVTPSYPSE